jgi:hypothetical protein
MAADSALLAIAGGGILALAMGSAGAVLSVKGRGLVR